MRPIHLYQAWKILPWTAKGLLIVGEGVSGIVYWAGTHADPRYGCLTDICNVTRQGIDQTIFFGEGLIVLCTLILVFSLVTVGITLDSQEKKGKSFEEMNSQIHAIEKQANPSRNRNGNHQTNGET